MERASDPKLYTVTWDGPQRGKRQAQAWATPENAQVFYARKWAAGLNPQLEDVDAELAARGLEGH